jgi:hypothetical protein
VPLKAFKDIKFFIRRRPLFKMKVVSKRVSILEKDNVFSLVILPTVDKKKTGMLFLWLMAWTVCGIIVFANYFNLNNKEAKVFIIVYLAFWVYFEFKISRAFLWKKFGKEKLWVKQGTLYYQREVSGRGKIREFDLQLLGEFRYLELSHTSFSDQINQSFWVKGGERLEFDYQAKVIRFGMQLSDEEARETLKEIKKFIKRA